MDTTTYLIIAFFGVPIVLGIIRGIVIVVGGKRRAKEMRQLAVSMNFSFEAKGDDALVSSLTHLPMFSDGRHHRMRNVMRGRVDDIDVTVMDHEYTAGSAGSAHSKTHLRTVIEIRSSLLRIPSFALTPQGWLHNIAIGLGAPDINFDSHPSFSRQYLLFGDHEEAIRSFFTGDILEFYEQRGEWSTSGDGDRLVLHKSSKPIPPRGIRSFLEEGLELFLLFKAASGKSS